MRTILLVLSLALNVWMGFALAGLENYHYASQMGMCDEFKASEGANDWAKKDACLNDKQTRTSALWHVFYALKDTLP